MPADSRKPRRVPLKGSKKAAFTTGKRVGPAPKAEEVTVTLRLRRKSPLASPCEAADFRTVGYDEFRALHGADPDDVVKVEAFAQAHGLVVPRVSLAQRAVDLAGTVEAMEQAFGVKLERYTERGRSFRIRTGEIKIPADLAGIVEGVFGLDNRPRVQPHFRIAKGTSGSRVNARATVKGFTPLEVAALYAFPKGVDGKGQTIAILEFGGGYRAAELNKYFAKLGIKPPRVIAVSVGAAHNAPTGNPDSADAEVLLDIEVAGAVAPAAQIVVYFAPNTDDGFINALYAAVHDNLRRPSIVSISWGAPEKESTLQSLKDYDAACVDAAALGITICAAAGDHGSSDTNPPAKRANVDFPASSPHVLACGGTHLEAKNGAITLETVWNTHDGWATGGGVSEVFKLPDYQKRAGVPKTANPGGKSGRGVPDVAGNGDSETGYRILVDGATVVVGGTSAVAPLWAGLIARLNQAKGTRLGFVHARLYAAGAGKGFRDIVQGDNGAYKAKAGWDPCTGLGSPVGESLREQL
jgi:kumamolisin